LNESHVRKLRLPPAVGEGVHVAVERIHLAGEHGDRVVELLRQQHVRQIHLLAAVDRQVGDQRRRDEAAHVADDRFAVAVLGAELEIQPIAHAELAAVGDRAVVTVAGVVEGLVEAAVGIADVKAGVVGEDRESGIGQPLAKTVRPAKEMRGHLVVRLFEIGLRRVFRPDRAHEAAPEHGREPCQRPVDRPLSRVHAASPRFGLIVTIGAVAWPDWGILRPAPAARSSGEPWQTLRPRGSEEAVAGPGRHWPGSCRHQ
jgi:hypothetical protein